MSVDMTEAEFNQMLRERASEPQVRALMPVLNRLYDGDGYSETEDGFSWLVIDASRIVDFVEGDCELNPGAVDDPRSSVLNALEDSARWDPSEGEPTEIVDAILAALHARGDT